VKLQGFNDPRQHKVFVGTGGPGTGKTRFDWEVLDFVVKYLDANPNDVKAKYDEAVNEIQSNQEIQRNPPSFDEFVSACKNHVRIFTSFGNGTPIYMSLESNCDKAFAARILHSYVAGTVQFQFFQEHLLSALPYLNSIEALRLVLRHAINMRYPNAQNRPKHILTLVVLDEFQACSSVPELKSSLGMYGDIIMNPMSVDDITIFANILYSGTDSAVAQKFTSESGFPKSIFHFPFLPLEDCLAIGTKFLSNWDHFQPKTQKAIQLAIADTGGHPRSLENLLATIQLKTDNLAVAWENALVRLQEHYSAVLMPNFRKYIPYAILGIKILDPEQQQELENLEKLGILAFRNGVVQIPFIFLSLLAKHETSFFGTNTEYFHLPDYLKQDSTPENWQTFEYHVSRIEAIRFSFFARIQMHKHSVKDVFQNALCNFSQEMKLFKVFFFFFFFFFFSSFFFSSFFFLLL